MTGLNGGCFVSVLKCPLFWKGHILFRKIPVRVYSGFQGETKMIMESFDNIEDAVRSIVSDLSENEAIRKEHPETPQYTFWITDNLPTPKGVRRAKNRH